ncbi:2Fe-2S iron-sulfur cluster binding domain-containing protein [Glutamicibacter soli]|uniref:2Fe-2S iron-sulfur cluster binding domain-containing protein n=1 Tax=Glutamicibacter soli TaxID=453836 RepID=A0A6L9G9W0_9MICC|nr:PDR/VanB family oxidoreductase [Glutamicibacter soli]NAZ17908.1 2Fe-2S iron-sulfur cluster binding domain-containing protein [Glutamicibacter soli]
MSTLEFFETEVHRLTAESDGVLSMDLRHPQGQQLPEWSAGAHLDLRLPNGLVRQYSLCSDPGRRDTWRLAVLREPAGRGGSAFVHDQLRPGAKIEVRGPKNNFALAPAKEYLFLAGGIGITPIMPMVRAAAAGDTPWRLVYLGRSRRSMAFLDELAGYGENVQIHADDEQGRFALDELLADPAGTFDLYACGPGPLLAVIESLAAEWVDPSRLHFERFVADPGKAAEAVAPQEGDHEFTVEGTDGSEVLVPVGTSILQALENAGKSPLNSCREGICGTCETAVVSGEIDHRDSLLSKEEQDAGDTMMICVSRCKGKRLVLDLE